ncbi:MAG TPA: HEAT repeat domain-containing protein [Candidatus Ruania gallistercoris]|uniref:HEAT repeat domain-containing protein n=1 Tax=Candidatus Ruania gallistercoris TaxID=2838746 RepID=A0A9D2J5R9_9MICO|nr:HEAT repeat domain-containing protein [Candidatus Ruania gallistercoris]
MLIGEVARRSGVSVRMLRHYDSLALVRPTDRTPGGYREYSAGDLRRIFAVESLRSLGLSLREVQQALEDPQLTPEVLVGDLVRRSEERVAHEQELLVRLRQIEGAKPEEWTDVLRIVELLRGLTAGDANRRLRTALASSAGTYAPADQLAQAALSEPELNAAGALRWALAQAGDDVPPPLAEGLTSPVRRVRQRAVEALAELRSATAQQLLVAALADDVPQIRRRAALVLGARGVTAALPTLLETVENGPNDVDAAEALGVLARDGEQAERIVAELGDRLAAPATPPAARLRLTQALAEIPGPAAEAALTALAGDDQGDVARSAGYILGLRSR